MSQKDRQEWEALQHADPQLRAAWEDFAKQLAHDAAFLILGVRPTGQAIGAAAQRVIDQATAPDSANND